jgi:hypothetical protein
VDIAGVLGKLNYLAVVVAALSGFVVGGVWYSALFAKAWTKETGLSEEDLRRRSPAAVFGGAFIASLISSLVLAMFLGPTADAAFGATAGLFVGLGWVATSLTTTFLFERRSLRLIAIDAGYHVVAFTIMGLILGAWH